MADDIPPRKKVGRIRRAAAIRRLAAIVNAMRRNAFGDYALRDDAEFAFY